jgi:hypothetical protein
MHTPTIQDVSWILDLHEKKQLDLDPSYQRRSVWSPRDRRMFLDTVFRNWPTGSVYLHKTLSEAGSPTYHVVDGKQRLQSLIMYSKDEVRLPDDFGDERFNRKRFSGLAQEQKEIFWNYQLTVEMLTAAEISVVNEVFDRLNRNAKKLTRQELRHAKWDGAFMRLVEAEAEEPFWEHVGIRTRARERRMKDVEFISELLLLTMRGVEEFSQDAFDDAYAEYDEEVPNADQTRRRFADTKQMIYAIDQHLALAKTRYSNFTDFYTLWSALLDVPIRDAAATAEALREFERELDSSAAASGIAGNVQTEISRRVERYAHAARGGATHRRERADRREVLIEVLKAAQ